MKGLEPKNAHIGALALLGAVLFNPPLIEVFDTGPFSTVGGVPLLYFYLFFAWALLIGLMAFVIERPLRGGGERTAIARKEDRPAAG
jgi:hypothetical protein